MHFGQLKKTEFSNWALLLILLFLISGCDEKRKDVFYTFSTPYQGQNFNAGETIKIGLESINTAKIDSVSYFIDGKIVQKVPKANSVLLPTNNLPLGYRLITAVVYSEKQADTIVTNIVLKTDKKPVQLAYKVINSFPHDTSAYTQGLSYVDGKLLESTGEKGASTLRYVDLNTGKVLQQAKLEPQYFGEGCLKIGDKIIMLTWLENIGFIFDAKTFKQLGTFPYQNSKEGWGLAYDGKRILRSDGTNRIWFMNAQTYKEEGYLEVYDYKGQVASLNELEYINGKIYANVYLSNKIVIINPVSGAVEQEIDLSALVPKNYFKTQDEVGNNVLNGIAWDEKGKRLFVGGKKWPTLYEIKLAN